MRVLTRKYVLQLGWRLQLAPQPAVWVEGSSSSSSGAAGTAKDSAAAADTSRAGGSSSSPSSSSSSGSSSALASGLVLLDSLLLQLECQLAAAQADLLTACRRGLVHGTLLALRSVAEELPWARWAAVASGEAAAGGAAAAAAGGASSEQDSGAAAVRARLQRLLAALLRVSALVLPLLAAQV